MREKELQFFREILLKKLWTLDYQYRLRSVPNREDGSLDAVDQANNEFEKGLFFHLHERESQATQEILQALRRMEEGTFGICMDCNGRITYRRMIANPSATLCIKCQKIKEQIERGKVWNGKRPLKYLEF